MMKTTTCHRNLGYVENLDIIEAALTENFGLSDASYVMRALAAHVWSQICQQTTEEKKWGTVEIKEAISIIKGRVVVLARQINSL